MMRLIAMGRWRLPPRPVSRPHKSPFQLPAGRLYVFHSGPRSGCQALIGISWRSQVIPSSGSSPGTICSRWRVPQEPSTDGQAPLK